jgi:hypothetical protein
VGNGNECYGNMERGGLKRVIGEKREKGATGEKRVRSLKPKGAVSWKMTSKR